MKKTNAARLLDKLSIEYEIVSYETDEDLSAAHIAELNGFDLRHLYKTLVLNGDTTGIIVAVVEGGSALSLKKVAALSRNKTCELLPATDLQKFTGYIRGGCSPIGMKKRFPTFIDDSILTLDYVYVNAGKKGFQLRLKPADLVKATEGVVVALKMEG